MTRSPLPTEAAVRSASSPKAVTFTHRVMPSPPGMREGRSRARRSSTPCVPSRVVKVRGSSPRRPVTVTLIGFMGFLPGAVTGRAGRPGGGPGLWGPSRRSDARAAQGRDRPPGSPARQDVLPAAQEEGAPAQPAPESAAASAKDLWPARSERSERPVAGPTAWRKLTRPGREQPQSCRQCGPVGSRLAPEESGYALTARRSLLATDKRRAHDRG